MRTKERVMLAASVGALVVGAVMAPITAEGAMTNPLYPNCLAFSGRCSQGDLMAFDGAASALLFGICMTAVFVVDRIRHRLPRTLRI